MLVIFCACETSVDFQRGTQYPSFWETCVRCKILILMLVLGILKSSNVTILFSKLEETHPRIWSKESQDKG